MQHLEPSKREAQVTPNRPGSSQEEHTLFHEASVILEYTISMSRMPFMLADSLRSGKLCMGICPSAFCVIESIRIYTRSHNK